MFFNVNVYISSTGKVIVKDSNRTPWLHIVKSVSLNDYFIDILLHTHIPIEINSFIGNYIMSAQAYSSVPSHIPGMILAGLILLE